MKRLLVLMILALPVLQSCANMDYDISYGFNKEIKLFEKEISVPAGNIGPFTLDYALGSVKNIEGVGALLDEFLKVDTLGNLVFEASGPILKKNVYEIASQMDDTTVPSAWTYSYSSGFVGGLAVMLGYLNLQPVDQTLSIVASNPLSVLVEAGCDAKISFQDYSVPAITLDTLSNFRMERWADSQELYSIEFSNDVTSTVAGITFENIVFNMPADPVSKISDPDENVFFDISYRHKAGIAPTSVFNLPLGDISLKFESLPVGQFNLSKCDVSFELESTVPITVCVEEVKVMKHSDDPSADVQPDPNIAIESGFVVNGGSPEHPATTPVKVTIEALEGTIPDIEGVILSISLEGPEGLPVTGLNVHQGVTVKNASVKLSGGITIPNKLEL